jgi:hypothetical protein
MVVETSAVPDKQGSRDSDLEMDGVDCDPEHASQEADSGSSATTANTMKATATFDQMVIWSHEHTAASIGVDLYSRSVQEWIQTAEQVSAVVAG